MPPPQVAMQARSGLGRGLSFRHFGDGHEAVAAGRAVRDAAHTHVDQQVRQVRVAEIDPESVVGTRRDDGAHPVDEAFAHVAGGVARAGALEGETEPVADPGSGVLRLQVAGRAERCQGVADHPHARGEGHESAKQKDLTTHASLLVPSPRSSASWRSTSSPAVRHNDQRREAAMRRAGRPMSSTRTWRMASAPRAYPT
jgi:hypothetical protein